MSTHLATNVFWQTSFSFCSFQSKLNKTVTNRTWLNKKGSEEFWFQGLKYGSFDNSTDVLRPLPKNDWWNTKAAQQVYCQCHRLFVFYKVDCHRHQATSPPHLLMYRYNSEFLFTSNRRNKYPLGKKKQYTRIKYLRQTQKILALSSIDGLSALIG